MKKDREHQFVVKAEAATQLLIRINLGFILLTDTSTCSQGAHTSAMAQQSPLIQSSLIQHLSRKHSINLNLTTYNLVFRYVTATSTTKQLRGNQNLHCAV